MNSSQRHKKYLGVYRRQLGRELDAMGYGRTQENVHIVERQNRKGLTSWLVVATLVMATLVLTGTLI